MDLVLGALDRHILTPYVFPSGVDESVWWRQLLSLHVIVIAGGYALYFIIASLSYLFLFDKRLMKHPLILENQIRREITYTCKSIPVMGLLTAPIFFAEVRGYSRLYDDPADTLLGWPGVALSIFTFIMFTDALIYWIHRFLHHKLLYKRLHKPHHWWKIPTPFASHAFHPVDGWAQSVPYHIYPFLFPLHKITYLALFVFVNFWTVSIHDGNYKVPELLKPFVNGSAHHTDHHLFYNFNYGQFFTLWDRLGGSFRQPSAWSGGGPLETVDRRSKESQTNGHEIVTNGHQQKTNGTAANGLKND